MKNIIFIDSLNGCECDLVSNINDQTNKIILEIKADVAKNPRLEINSTSVNIASDIFVYEIPSSYYTGVGELRFRIVDSEHTGDYFSITKLKEISGNLFLKQVSNFVYTLSLISDSAGQATTVSVQVGETQTLPPGSDAAVYNSGDDKNVVLNFQIPKGEDGKTPQMLIDEDGHLIAIYD